MVLSMQNDQVNNCVEDSNTSEYQKRSSKSIQIESYSNAVICVFMARFFIEYTDKGRSSQKDLGLRGEWLFFPY